MLQTEFVRNLNCNYERILLDKKPKEKKYQYCILNHGGIKGLLPCTLRYINGLAYLYYDITSKQNVMQLFGGKCITREWVKDFIWSLKSVQQESERFLLDTNNILWYPEQVFQDLESNIFSFLYVPYYEGEGAFLKMLEFWVEHIDYSDEGLVECVYNMYEQYEKNGDVYLQNLIFEDAEHLENNTSGHTTSGNTTLNLNSEEMTSGDIELPRNEIVEKTDKPDKKGIRYFFDERRRRNKQTREQYQQDCESAMNGYAVAEEEEYGKTIYIEETQNQTPIIRKLYSIDGKILAILSKPTFSIGKRKGEVDLVLEDIAVSRIHARIIQEGKEMYLEDLNSTNGTFKNGLRMQPYEKRKLEAEDEIKCGKTVLIYR